MYKKLVGIVIMTLLIATALPAVGTMTENKIPASLGMSDNSLMSPSTQRSTNSINRGGMFIQLPPSPEDPDSSSWTSDLRLSYQVYDDFWEVIGPICDVHWWGCSIYWTGSGWKPCDPPVDMTFNISFHKDDGSGMPGDIVCSYVDVLPSMTETGIYYWSAAGFYKQLYYFEYDLNPCCDLLNGWISIVCTGNKIDGHFLWMHSYDGNSQSWQHDTLSGGWDFHEDDLAFILTDGEPAIPVLECDGELRQTEVPPGTNVTGDFVVRNNGDADSVLQWRIDNTSLPNWGSNWTIIPSADFQTPDMGWLTVIVNFTAPDEKGEYNGKIKVVNVLDSSEYCEIDVNIQVPRSRATYNTLLLRLFERFPNAFPILRQLLGLR